LLGIPQHSTALGSMEESGDLARDIMEPLSRVCSKSWAWLFNISGINYDFVTLGEFFNFSEFNFAFFKMEMKIHI
jgi:hypothetical protein